MLLIYIFLEVKVTNIILKCSNAGLHNPEACKDSHELQEFVHLFAVVLLIIKDKLDTEEY